jgi:hypothetical protein
MEESREESRYRTRYQRERCHEASDTCQQLSRNLGWVAKAASNGNLELALLKSSETEMAKEGVNDEAEELDDVAAAQLTLLLRDDQSRCSEVPQDSGLNSSELGGILTGEKEIVNVRDKPDSAGAPELDDLTHQLDKDVASWG